MSMNPTLAAFLGGLALAVPRLEGEAAGPIPPCPFDRVHELEIEPADPHLVDGLGPTVVIEYEAEFSGALHMWTRSELELSLTVEDSSTGELLGRDDDSGGAATPYLRLAVEQGSSIAVLVAVRGSVEQGRVDLHLVASPESEASRAAAATAWTRLSEEGPRGREAARAWIADLFNGLTGASGAVHGDSVEEALHAVGSRALQMGDLGTWATTRSLRLAHYRRTLPPDHPWTIKAAYNAGVACARLGDHDGAIELYRGVVAIREWTLPADHADLFRARSAMARVLGMAGDHLRAAELQRSALEQVEGSLPGDHPDVLSARESLGILYDRIGDSHGARAVLESVVEARRHLPDDHGDLLSARSNLSVVLRRLGAHDEARELVESVIAARARTLGELHPDLLRARTGLSDVLSETGELREACALQEIVLAGLEEALPEGHPQILDCLSNLGGTYYSLGDLSRAIDVQRRVVHAGRGRLPRDHPMLLGRTLNLALSMWKADDAEPAFAMVRDVLPHLEAGVRASLTLGPRQAREALHAYAGLVDIVVAISGAGGADLQRAVFELVETMRVVATEASRRVLQSDDPEVRDLLHRGRVVRAELGELAAGHRGLDPGSFDEELRSLMEDRDAVEGRASRLLAARGIVTRAVRIPELTGSLGPGDAIVVYRRWSDAGASGERLLAHVLTPEGALNRVDLGNVVELRSLVAAWRSAVGEPLLTRGVTVAEPVFRPVDELHRGARLRERILDPLLEGIQDASRIYVCADDLVFLVPLDALPAGQDRVGDRLTVCHQVSLANLGRGSKPGGPDRASFLVVGDPEYGTAGEGETPWGRPFTELPETRTEAEALAALFDELHDTRAERLVGRAATRTALLEKVAGKRFLHLATHGWFAPELISVVDRGHRGHSPVEERVRGMAPMLLCGLALAGANAPADSSGRKPGLLTAEELCSLDLSACDLAVLSACETNVGLRRAGQGIQSLQAALYAAGARSSITSLWKVDDAATRRLMELFYTHLWEERMSRAEALWGAKRALRSEGAPVRDWAGWVLTGDID